jgi:hypothetical protein
MSSALWDGKTEHKSFVLKREDLLPLSSACDILMIMLAARSHIAKDGACYIGERIIYADSATVFYADSYTHGRLLLYRYEQLMSLACATR